MNGSGQNASNCVSWMRNGISCAALLAGVFGALTTTEIASAQEAEVSNSNEIVITARRRSERLQDVPVAVTALSGKQLETYNVTSIGDMSTFVPGMVVGRQVSGSAASIFLRGVGSGSLSAGFDQSVSFNLDGLAMSRGREMLFSQYDLSTVEVLKGPQALYFGRNTTGGLITLTTNGPGDEFEAGGKIGYGFEADETYAEGYISGPVSDSFGARFAFRANNSEGAFVNTARAAYDPGITNFLRSPFSSRRGANDAVSGRLTLDYHPNADFHLLFKGGYTDYNDDAGGTLYERKCGSDRGVPRTVPRPLSGIVDPYADCNVDGRTPHSAIPVEVLTPNFRWARNGVPYTDLQSGFAILNGTYDFSNLSLNSISAYYGFKQVDLRDTLGATRTNGVTQYADFEQFSEELRLSTKYSGPVNFTVGAFLASTNFDFKTDVYINNAAYDPVNNTYLTFAADNGFKANTTSVFGEVVWNITPTVEFSGGARWSRDERDSFQHSLPAASSQAAAFPQNVFIFDHFADENVSPQATLSWRPNHDVSWYVAYKEGYKTGGFNLSQTITAACAPTVSNPMPCLRTGKFVSETASGWEAGVRSTLYDGHLQLNVTIYDYLYENLQVQFYNPVTSGQVVGNAGELSTKGVETEFSFFPPGVEHLSFHGAVAYNKAEYGNFIGQCFAGQVFSTGCNQFPNTAGTVYNGQVFSGRTPPKAPEWAAQFGGAYELPLSSSLMARFVLDGNYSSEYNYTDTLRPDGVQEAFTRWDATLSLVNAERGWTLSLIGRNLTDELIVATANDMTGTGAGTTGNATGGATITPDMNVMVERPREIYLELGMRF